MKKTRNVYVAPVCSSFDIRIERHLCTVSGGGTQHSGGMDGAKEDDSDWDDWDEDLM